MSRYIDADAFGREMYHEAFETDTDMQRWDSGCWIRYKLFEEILKKQPTADVRENVNGEWVNNIHDLPICNKCGYMTPYDRAIDDYEYGNFCPNCGADMRKGDHNG